jgi:SAM-dependent methyltransferase
LQNQALAPHHRLLDVGCGPLRAGEHLIDYLDASNYCGVDYNADFIRTAKELVAQNPALERKKPSLLQLDNFNFSQLRGPFDYVLAFSVLNHCDAESKARFFRELPQVLKETSRVYLTHAAWFDSSMLAGSTLKLVTKLAGPGDVSPGLDMAAWGWPPTESIYPILQLGLSNP